MEIKGGQLIKNDLEKARKQAKKYPEKWELKTYPTCNVKISYLDRINI